MERIDYAKESQEYRGHTIIVSASDFQIVPNTSTYDVSVKGNRVNLEEGWNGLHFKYLSDAVLYAQGCIDGAFYMHAKLTNENHA